MSHLKECLGFSLCRSNWRPWILLDMVLFVVDDSLDHMAVFAKIRVIGWFPPFESLVEKVYFFSGRELKTAKHQFFTGSKQMLQPIVNIGYVCFLKKSNAQGDRYHIELTFGLNIDGRLLMCSYLQKRRSDPGGGYPPGCGQGCFGDSPSQFPTTKRLA